MLRRFSIYALLCVPAFIFFWYFFRYVVDVPWFDDIEAFPGFLLDYLKANGLAEKFQLLIKPNNEHRIVFGKSVLLLIYHLTGQMHFDWMMLIGNLSIVGIFLLLVRAFSKTITNHSDWFYLLPVAFLLFQPHYHLLTFWAITGLQHQPTAFLVLLSLYLLVKVSNTRLLFAAICLLFATFSMSNGMFGWVAGLAILLLQKRFKALAIWTLLMLLAVWLYFRGFTTQGNEAGISYFLHYPHKTILAFFAFIGGIVDFIPSRFEPYRFGLPIIGGVLLFAYLLVWLWQWLPKTSLFNKKSRDSQSLDSFNYFMIGGLAYLLVNAAVVALLRPRFGFSVLVVSNYKLYPTLFAVMVYLLWVRRNTTRTMLVVALSMSLLINGLAYWRFTPEVIKRQRNLLTHSFNQAHNQVGLGGMVGTPLKDYIAQTMNQCVEKGLYQYPQSFVSDKELNVKPLVDASLALQIIESPQDFAVIHPTYIENGGKDDGLYIVFRSVQHTYLFYTEPVPYQGRNPFRQGKGYVSFVQKSILYPGDYHIGTLERNHGSYQIRYTNQQVKL